MFPDASLTIAAQPDKPLSPAQRKFNQLVRKIELARAELQAWETHAPLFAQAYAHRVQPLQKDVAQCKRQLSSVRFIWRRQAAMPMLMRVSEGSWVSTI